MIDALRLWLNRPLGDGDRRRLFLVAATAIAAGAIGLALIDRPAPQPAPRLHTAPPRTTTPAAPAATTGPSLEVPSEEAAAPSAEPTPQELAAAKRDARRFLAGYLPYTYGQRSAQRIPDAAAALRRRLASQRPRVPRSERHRTPRVVLVQADSIGTVRAAMTALVDDGARRYTVPLQLTRLRSGWQVTDVGG